MSFGKRGRPSQEQAGKPIGTPLDLDADTDVSPPGRMTLLLVQVFAAISLAAGVLMAGPLLLGALLDRQLQASTAGRHQSITGVTKGQPSPAAAGRPQLSRSVADKRLPAGKPEQRRAWTDGGDR